MEALKIAEENNISIPENAAYENIEYIPLGNPGQDLGIFTMNKIASTSY